MSIQNQKNLIMDSDLNDPRTLEAIARSAQTSAYAVRDFRPARNHMRDKVLEGRAQLGLREIAPSLTVAANTPFTQTSTTRALGAPIGVNFEALGLGTPGYSVSVAPPDVTV